MNRLRCSLPIIFLDCFPELFRRGVRGLDLMTELIAQRLTRHRLINILRRLVERLLRVLHAKTDEKCRYFA